jgi:pSer/pThr/pTyr-binding forkhead associated (FHA) protein
VNDITLRAPGTDLDRLPLSQGRLAVGRAGDGGLCVLEDAGAARVSFCLDRRGTWLVVGDGVRGVHVNGRPVLRKALLRAGDTVYVDGVEIGLVKPVAAGTVDTPAGDRGSAMDPRVVLRGTSGPHHGRSLTLDRARSIGSAADADIRIDGLAAHHLQLAMEGGQAVLRVRAPEGEVLVNGQPCRSAVLQPGDQVAFDAHHRFVLEAPTPVLGLALDGDALDDLPAPEPRAQPEPTGLRMPWLLLAALVLAAALSALLLL